LGGLTVDRRARKMFVGGVEVLLSPKEYDLLALLAEDPGAVVTRQTILEDVRMIGAPQAKLWSSDSEDGKP
jgi:two-component system response regulator RegX3